MTKLNELVLAETKAKQSKKRIANNFDTRFATVLNASDTIALMQVSQEKAALNSLKKAQMYDYCRKNNLVDGRKAMKSFSAKQLKDAAVKFIDSKINELTQKSKELAEKFLPDSMSAILKEIVPKPANRSQDEQGIEEGEEEEQPTEQ